MAEVLIGTHKLSAGDRVLLVFFPGLDFTVSLLACFKAGLIGVPVFPPDPRKMKKDLRHFVNIQLSCGAKIALTNSLFSFAKKVENLKGMFSTESAQWPDLKWIVVDDVLKKGKSGGKGKKSGVTLPRVSQSDIAFLQYTSGSTSDPKGVMISHSNLAHNLTLITRELKADKSTVNVSWLPQYHDMGLIGIVVQFISVFFVNLYCAYLLFLNQDHTWVFYTVVAPGTIYLLSLFSKILLFGLKHCPNSKAPTHRCVAKHVLLCSLFCNSIAFYLLLFYYRVYCC